MSSSPDPVLNNLQNYPRRSASPQTQLHHSHPPVNASPPPPPVPLGKSPGKSPSTGHISLQERQQQIKQQQQQQQQQLLHKQQQRQHQKEIQAKIQAQQQAQAQAQAQVQAQLQAQVQAQQAAAHHHHPQLPPQVPPQQPQGQPAHIQPPVQPTLEKLPPGTVFKVGKHEAKIVKYLSEGGFAHIYVVEISPPENGSNIACLKRVIVPNKEGLNLLRAEVEVMQRLSGCDNVVNYYDSNASRMGNTHFYEVLVLMELCTNKSLLDYMNSRLTTKLTESEILKIMYDISKGVYYMHSLKLIHRDIKIENVLIDSNFNFKVCDFGSTCPILRVPRTQQEFQILQNDLLHQTTPQYRSPEMLDLYRGIPIDDKSDIWALGVFLYKLCYYTTPFENAGELAILHAAYKFPPNPPISMGIKNLINIMLQENPQFRPNIYQILIELFKLKGKDVSSLEIEDIFGLGEYRPPPVEQIHPGIEPFTASLVPVFSPFRSIPRSPLEMQMALQQQQQQKEEEKQQQKLKLQALEQEQASVLSPTSNLLSVSPSVSGGDISEQNTTDSSPSRASFLENVEERFPELDHTLSSAASRTKSPPYKQHASYYLPAKATY
ncbi:unnamed protein product [Ambrosiozyma monospora]|uniref:Unnamed protein product n=1 Tax=Ambrosiozyma monospora TaxID=43982 RepID=A0ACB5TC42_AMBMO|nr:unnamed protein product [Ambrosiozyma monospora]